jgi:hypothetical protein
MLPQILNIDIHDTEGGGAPYLGDEITMGEDDYEYIRIEDVHSSDDLLPEKLYQHGRCRMRIGNMKQGDG